MTVTLAIEIFVAVLAYVAIVGVFWESKVFIADPEVACVGWPFTIALLTVGAFFCGLWWLAGSLRFAAWPGRALVRFIRRRRASRRLPKATIVTMLCLLPGFGCHRYGGAPPCSYAVGTTGATSGGQQSCSPASGVRQ